MVNNEELVKYRLESLKMAYELNFKIGNLKLSYESDQEVKEDLQDVFSLAEINLQYIIEGIHPSDHDIGEEENGIIENEIV